MMLRWLTSLGTRPTPWDWDGSKHRRWFWAFVLVVVTASLLVTITGTAKAATCRDDGYKYVVESVLGNDMGWIQLKVHYCVRSAAECGQLYPCWGDVRWTKNYGNAQYHLDHWYASDTDSGRDGGVRWKNHSIGAQFEYCIVYQGSPLCKHFDVWLVNDIDTTGRSAFYGGTGSPPRAKTKEE